MTNVEKRVLELVQEKIGDREDIFIVSIRFLGNGVLEILLDGDQGVKIEDCAAVSRHVGFFLEEENVIEQAYRLEVSSPGIDAVFVHLRQYAKNLGRNVQVKTLDGLAKEGKLLAASETEVTIEETIKEKGKKATQVETVIPFDQIKATRVVISFK
ncbi:ribosome assembly cofactor RimP [Sphingobacteriaceae bacterium WQ 2009]|uniref:Ribosome maturation factor RimP n=1 Tax=Rhinopithecimicrobium faecis TaxID=2820698 RepID=A0A8T4H996_9SPHI|nr:ribosome assembly cofactor RimP [Sphingobacteriaceae bacterium WQ 2009]